MWGRGRPLENQERTLRRELVPARKEQCQSHQGFWPETFLPHYGQVFRLALHQLIGASVENGWCRDRQESPAPGEEVVIQETDSVGS